MKKLLILTPRYPYPVIGGDRLRIYNICKVLSKHFRLTLLSLCDQPSEMQAPLPDDGVFHEIERIYLPRWHSRLNTLLALPTQTPLQVAYYRSRAFNRRIQTLAPRHDGVLAHLIRTGDAIRHLDMPKFLEMTDAISLNYARVKKERGTKLDLRSRIYATEAKRLRKYEQKIVTDFDQSFLVSSIDHAFLFQDHDVRSRQITIASNGVNLVNLPYHFSKSPGDLIFIGSMTTLQNLDAASFLAASVLPRVQKNFPQVKLRIIGRIGRHDKTQLEKHTGVIVTGEVDSIAHAARGGAVGVCSMRIGAGIQNKILEYMALGLPTVSTRLGLEGLEARHSHELLVADSAVELAQAIIYLLNDRITAETLALAGRRYVEENHSWESCISPILKCIQTSLSKS